MFHCLLIQYVGQNTEVTVFVCDIFNYLVPSPKYSGRTMLLTPWSQASLRRQIIGSNVLDHLQYNESFYS